jgi:histidyl-tRNA synthetase
MGEAAYRHSALLARELRNSGSAIEIAPEGKLKKSLELANKLAAKFTLIVGDNEIASGTYALKDMESGEQENVTKQQMIERITCLKT